MKWINIIWTTELGSVVIEDDFPCTVHLLTTRWFDTSLIIIYVIYNYYPVHLHYAFIYFCSKYNLHTALNPFFIILSNLSSSGVENITILILYSHVKLRVWGHSKLSRTLFPDSRVILNQCRVNLTRELYWPRLEEILLMSYTDLV